MIIENLIECSLWRIVIKGYLFMIIENLNECSLWRIVIKGYMFMIIDNLMEGIYWRVVIKGYMFMIIENLIECSLWRIVIKGYLFMIILSTFSFKDCHKGLFVYHYWEPYGRVLLRSSIEVFYWGGGSLCSHLFVLSLCFTELFL
jgi:hypothetical protein